VERISADFFYPWGLLRCIVAWISRASAGGRGGSVGAGRSVRGCPRCCALDLPSTKNAPDESHQTSQSTSPLPLFDAGVLCFTRSLVVGYTDRLLTMATFGRFRVPCKRKLSYGSDARYEQIQIAVVQMNEWVDDFSNKNIVYVKTNTPYGTWVPVAVWRVATSASELLYPCYFTCFTLLYQNNTTNSLQIRLAPLLWPPYGIGQAIIF